MSCLLNESVSSASTTIWPGKVASAAGNLPVFLPSITSSRGVSCIRVTLFQKNQPVNRREVGPGATDLDVDLGSSCVAQKYQLYTYIGYSAARNLVKWLCVDGPRETTNIRLNEFRETIGELKALNDRRKYP